MGSGFVQALGLGSTTRSGSSAPDQAHLGITLKTAEPNDDTPDDARVTSAEFRTLRNLIPGDGLILERLFLPCNTSRYTEFESRFLRRVVGG